ncbi:MAG: ubiquinone/menaquinone biosynthesis methyltransferase [Acidobacteriota bacterium]|nr:ubiquinone/menaquinone biosynthesis methyltransferase [Acidobacteriota bacterium]
MQEPAKVGATGAAPEGAQDEQSAAAAVRQMFSAVAPRYDLLNHLLSFNVDRLWWRRAARTFAPILARPEARVLDLCCGTGDLAMALRRETRDNLPPILGADFSHPMLQRATRKFRGRNLTALEADALRLPFADSSFDLVASAFGFRNLANYESGLREMRRVLRPEGECGILEFQEPTGFTGAVYGVYFRRVLPAVGSMISGVRGAYSYLPASVRRFPAAEEMLALMRAAGFREVSWTPYTFGIAGLFRGKK